MKAYEIWKPIFESLGYDGSQGEEIAEYCVIDNNKKSNYLPVSLKILTNIRNLKDIKLKTDLVQRLRDLKIDSIQDDSELPKHIRKIQVKIEGDTLRDLEALGNGNHISFIETQLIGESIKYLEKIIEDEKPTVMITDRLVTDIDIRPEVGTVMIIGEATLSFLIMND